MQSCGGSWSACWWLPRQRRATAQTSPASFMHAGLGDSSSPVPPVPLSKQLQVTVPQYMCVLAEASHAQGFAHYPMLVALGRVAVKEIDAIVDRSSTSRPDRGDGNGGEVRLVMGGVACLIGLMGFSCMHNAHIQADVTVTRRCRLMGAWR